VKAQDIREMSEEELFNLRFQHATGQLENTERLPEVRKDLARVKTILREKVIVRSKTQQRKENEI
jgi:large subunit ribosomal protein L29